MQAIVLLVFMSLPLAVLLTASVLGLVLLQEAFAPSAGAATTTVPGARLPLLSGGALRSWAAGWARQFVADFAARPRSPNTAVALARELESETSRLLDRSLPEAAARDPHCRECSLQPIRVTAPEALAIVDELRRHASPSDLRRVYARAQNNVRQRSLASPAETLVCPLLADDECCSVFAARPLYCRSHCGADCILATEPRHVDDRQSVGGFAMTLGEGVSEGLTQALETARLNGRSYELNHAVVQAVDVPNAAARWARGEQVFDVF
ncbi:MAG TPA: hypothetical protein VMV69_03310 [Pirellulales bacterium]|nr:hypothetical protein [Pirellulales bacterium]